MPPPAETTPPLFTADFSFERRPGKSIALAVRHNVGAHPDRPPLLLLHGFPQTHAIWHKVAPALAQRYTLVMPDLRGYGDSDKPPSSADHAPYSKRAMAADVAALMRGLGFDHYFVCCHDRGGRVAHRLALDFPQAVRKLMLLDISPTATMYAATDMAFARAYYHWFFLIQPEPLPETLIGAAPGFYLRNKLGGWGSRGTSFFDPRALAEYERCFTPATIHAMCEDYRAAAGIDLQHDAADERIQCPVHVLWGERGVVNKLFSPVADWQAKCAAPVTGRAVPSGHFIPEEQPDSLFDEVSGFAR
ncbi:MAG: alpha/beta hydrolase [Burkholderiales bacterium]|jgi:haloacetate dehalogenase|nr:alpha/beta hydrolase [Burkholderiales bacterium]